MYQYHYQGGVKNVIPPCFWPTKIGLGRVRRVRHLKTGWELEPALQWVCWLAFFLHI